MENRYVFKCDEEKASLVIHFMKSEFGIDVEEMKYRKSSRFATPAGAGFGDKVWRVNNEMESIEASFSRPCWQSKALKAAGFIWCHSRGLWFCTNEQKNADTCELLKLTHTDDVPKGVKKC